MICLILKGNIRHGALLGGGCWQVYEEWDGFKLNDTLEIFGILSVSPALSALADEK